MIIRKIPVFNGETVISEEYARFGKKVVVRSFETSDGKVLGFLCTVNPHADPAIIFAVTDHGTVFLVDQFRHATRAFEMELPGGCLKPGQTWEDAWEKTARAELREEVGVEATEMRVIGGRMPFNPALEDNYFRAVLATGCRVVQEQKLDDTEVMTIREVSLSEFRNMLRAGQITDAKTIAVGHLALDHLGLLGGGG